MFSGDDFMDCKKTGELILTLRKSLGLTQRRLAEIMNISDKTVSKWERGLGCPDVSLLPELSAALNVNIQQLLCGTLSLNDAAEGNMNKSEFYVCPKCGSLTVCSGNAQVSCCGSPLKSLVPQKDDSMLNISDSDGEWYITSEHEMTKDHYISFVAFLTGDDLRIVKLYPEWNMQVRLSSHRHGMLLWYCTKHGLFRKIL